MSTSVQDKKKDDNKIQISATKNSLSFYIYLAKKFLQNNEVVELSGLGSAINTVVSCAEILKNREFATISKIETSTVNVQGKNEQSFTKAKIQVYLKKTPKFDSLMKEEESKRTQTQQQK
ncbi:hypothetical protein ABK040_015546 [Willaertia magna]